MINAVYDLTSCTRADLEPGDLLDAMRATVTRLGCTILGELPVLFQPHGITCVVVLAESHLTVSTWPEHRLAHVDLFTCRADTDPEHALVPIIKTLDATHVHGQRIHRIDPNHLDETTVISTAMYRNLQALEPQVLEHVPGAVANFPVKLSGRLRKSFGGWSGSQAGR